MKKIIWFCTMTLLMLFVVLSNSCKKEKKNNNASTNNGIIFNQTLIYDTLTDIDGNIYKTITIGTQVWMAENLKVTKYRNGDPIPNVTDKTQWANLTNGAYCNYNNDVSKANIYGRLYNWYAVIDSRNIAPVGWHVATEAEWTTLSNYLGGDSLAGGKIKEISTLHWASPNTGADNSSGFTALPGGHRNISGEFLGFGYEGHWFSATELSSNRIYVCFLIYNYGEMIPLDYENNNGFSVRCVKD